ncbi:hypothetical protein HOP50_04g31080 [Chloropicon primus]|uniref:F-box domain-containing protein n=1 Tax=Chloropicon primus TaxID=1764295 RepID=A0A5B8MIY6_9CHLO|nr:hypothetical protein A3770_04p31060 [Chloropicon primus]UPQ99799.1 hypothetical protein HOP50_04g31080 [Chloropicon primus]|eukprot:QDZ20588.1 hypothetical protein A3770_04p31060 [Chloropicon primus]
MVVRRGAKHALDVLPEWAWLLVLEKLDDCDRVAFGLTCKTFLEGQLEEVTLMFCSGLEVRIRHVLGTSGLVLGQLEEVTLMFCSGLEVRIHHVLGTSGLVLGQLKEFTLMFCSGFEARIRLALGTQTVA